MLYHLLVPLAEQFTLFNVFRYITFRSGGAVMTALVISFVFGPAIIRWLKKKQREGQPIREDGPESHLLTKKGTPTMGGVLILIAIAVSTLLWADLTNGYVWVVLIVTLGFGGIGFADDLMKLTQRSSSGLSGRYKLLLQGIDRLVAATLVALDLTAPSRSATRSPCRSSRTCWSRSASLFPLVRRLRHRRRLQRRQPDRRPRRSRHRAGDDRRRLLRA